MLVVDAGVLFEVIVSTSDAEPMRQRMAADPDWAAPHVVDVEVFSLIRERHRGARLDRTAASQAVDDLSDWPGERFGHRRLMARAWELRADVRGWDAMYVTLAEALDATLITTDGRLERAPGLRCRIERFAPSMS